MKQGILCCLFILFSVSAFAQKENNVWTFSGAGLDFNSGAPVNIISKMDALEGSATICDASGNLLFYSDGLVVWDKTNNPMPNGKDLLGGPQTNATQGVAIAPIFGFGNLYYLFTIDEYNDDKTGQLRYSLIDMTLNGGLGDIVPGHKNILIGEKMSEKMIVAPGCNGVWLLTHHIDNPVFYAYRINSPYSIPAAVNSNTGGFSYSRNYYIGEMKLSHDGKRIAMGNWKMPILETLYFPDPKIELFDFDFRTGIVSGRAVIDSSNMAYSIEFSTDGSKLYYIEFGARLFQYDLSLWPDLDAIGASKTRVGTLDEYQSMRTGPDNKLYITNGNFSHKVFRINAPNLLAASCDLQTDIGLSKSPYISFGNNNVLPVTRSDSIVTSVKDTAICSGSAITIATISTGDNFYWNDGDLSLSKTISAEGKYWRTILENCNVTVDTFRISYKKNDTSYSHFDTSICFQQSIQITSPRHAAHYLWSDGSTLAQTQFQKPGAIKNLYTSNNDCTIAVDTYKVSITDFKLNISDASICKGETLSLDASVQGVSDYQWQDGSSNPRYTISTPGIYTVSLSENGCLLKETFELSVRDCDNCLLAPTAFTPNNDGRNDLFRPLVSCTVKQYSMMVVNRFGQVVFRSENISDGWDGRFNNKDEGLGVYYYLIKVKFDQNFAKEQLYKGEVTLIR